jgi:hypothetical protein
VPAQQSSMKDFTILNKIGKSSTIWHQACRNWSIFRSVQSVSQIRPSGVRFEEGK